MKAIHWHKCIIAIQKMSIQLMRNSRPIAWALQLLARVLGSGRFLRWEERFEGDIAWHHQQEV
jgi:hypothetical protein